MEVEMLDSRRIKFCGIFQAPLNTVFEVWNHPAITHYIMNGKNKQLNSQLEKLKQTTSKVKTINRLNEISSTSVVSNKITLYAHFLQQEECTVSTITVDFKVKGLAQRLITPASHRAVQIQSNINQYLLGK